LSSTVKPDLGNANAGRTSNPCPFDRKGTKVQKLIKAAAILAATIFTAVSLTACSTSSQAAEITVVVHDSVSISKELLASFTKQTGVIVHLLKAGDAGAMTNKLVLTKDAPIGDAVYGIDNTFAGVAKENKIIDGELTAIDFGDVCMNYDKTWFAMHEQAAPASINDLIKPAFDGLTVIENPTTSSTGLAFLTATVSVFGDHGWQPYWQALKNNNVKVDAGWEDAYYTDFSGSSGKGNYPIVLSYSSSPADEVRENGESQAEALLDSCYRQTEYAGVLAGAKHKAFADLFVKFLKSAEFQASLPGSMYVYPIVEGTALPESWAQFAPMAAKPVGGELDVNANRDAWLKAWAELFAQ
jgi:thiamine transport system substrate-binding protein